LGTRSGTQESYGHVPKDSMSEENVRRRDMINLLPFVWKEEIALDTTCVVSGAGAKLAGKFGMSGRQQGGLKTELFVNLCRKSLSDIELLLQMK